ncbi:MAG: glycerol-3-phosphate dehydrogenase [Alphaproteobacteria bacterium]|nr:glycerol-3-phosphate dehydrogenase [Alphaproteobacteria bacterium]MDE2011437.1 glycerol-3-phosphate dehydrogenase [Alphaproteobacteria bacterium]MDE2071828.1 glycerol-3-phosphate dehydrogenase [Alphaproteobacteria bacterium]MDE2350499.1 glycerol-3-phosphate dehydrogenase [Alphaproteobacteria bacterium]
MSREGSLAAPTRHALDWRNPDFYDAEKLDAEMRRVFDICHGCRRCFNLCESFPRLFDLVDASPDEMAGVKSEDFGKVVEACTLCDMCYMTKCPYVPPHEFNLDFPHLMLRYRAAEAKKGNTNTIARQLGEMDRNGTLARVASPVINWASEKSNGLTRPLMAAVADIDRDAVLPKFHSKTFVAADRGDPITANASAPAYGKRKAAIFATCFANYNRPQTGMAARAVLNHLGVATRVAYPGCCGMPFLEQADLARVAENAVKVSGELVKLIDEGYDIVVLTASCGLMFKSEWPLILPDNAEVKKLAAATFDIDEYVVDVAKKQGLPDGLSPLPEGITVHLPCHARAQNMGPKAAEMLKLIPDTPVDVIERCSGHGGTFGVLKETHGLAKKVGKPVFRAAAAQARGHIASDCPLAGMHIVNGAREAASKEGKELPVREAEHPIEIFARAYGLKE